MEEREKEYRYKEAMKWEKERKEVDGGRREKEKEAKKRRGHEYHLNFDN